MRYHVMDGGGFIERTLDNPIGRQILYGVPVCVDTHVNIRPRSYGSREDAQAVADWLNERSAGYPMRSLPWPVDDYTSMRLAKFGNKCDRRCCK